MIQKTVDLYKEFGLERPSGARGYLSCMALTPLKSINEDRRFPAILIIPGGAYRFVAQREAEPVALAYASRGFSTFALEYSVAPFCYPTSLREAAMAMLYIRENAEELYIDPNMVAALGFSAGAHLCGCLATMSDSDTLSELMKGRSCDVRPDAVMFGYPVILSEGKTHRESILNISGGDSTLGSYLSIDKHVDENTPPAFIWHTQMDALVPVANSLALAQAFERAGVPFELHIFEKGPHGLSAANDLVYRVSTRPEFGKNVPQWLNMSCDWLEDHGLKIVE